MDFERGAEFASKEEPKRESSYSEKDQAKVVEGSTVDVKQVGSKRNPLPSIPSRRDKIISVYKANLEKIFQLVESISILNGKNFRQEEHIVEEIKLLRHTQEELLNALILEQKGSLSQESISKGTWNLIN